MVISLVCLLLVAGVAYFHWVQGVFSGAISMALALVAATLAIGMHESIVANVLGGKMADFANGIVLCVTFALVYGIGRVAFDSLVPGNVRVPLYFDKVGGLVCGLVAGLCGVGVFAVALQSMPLGPSIVGFSRYEIDEDKQVVIAGSNGGRQQDAEVSGVIKVDDEAAALPDASKESGLLLGVDSTVVDYVGYQSKAGAFAGSRPFAADHPNLLRELFFGRVGIEGAAKRVALNVGGRSDVTLAGLYAPETLPQAEGEIGALRARNLPKQLVGDAKNGRVLFVVRLTPGRTATDTDGKFRFSTGAIRLVADGKDFYPVGTMHYANNIGVMLAARADDYLIGNGKPFDVVFDLARADVVAEGDAGALKVKPNVFVEVKRYGRVEIAGKPVEPALAAVAESGVDRRGALVEQVAKRIAESSVR